MVQLFLVLSVLTAFVFGIQAQETCEYSYIYGNVGPSFSSSVNFGCVDPSGCVVLYSPKGCGCNATCSGTVRFPASGNLLQGQFREETISGWDVGDLLCSTGQIVATHSGSFELAPANQAGTKLAYTIINNARQTCELISIGEGNTTATFYEDETELGSIEFSQKYEHQTLSRQFVVGSSDTIRLSVLSTGPVLMGCTQGNSQNFFTVVQNLSPDPVYGWVSSISRGIHVNCSDLSPAAAIPDCERSSIESGLSLYTDPEPSGVGFTGVFGAEHSQSAQEDYGPPAFQCESNELHCMVAYSGDDGSGNQLTSWLTYDKFSDYFVIIEDLDLSSLLSEYLCLHKKWGSLGQYKRVWNWRRQSKICIGWSIVARGYN